MLLLCMFFCFICISLFVSFIWFTFTVEWIPYKIFLYRGIITIKKSWVKPVQPPCWHPASSTPLPLSCQFWLQEYLVQLLVLIATQYFLASLLCGSQTEVWFVMKLHSLKSISYTHPENKNSYISMLFVVFSSAFNTISPMKPIGKLNTGLEYNTLHLVLDFHTSRPQRVQIGSHSSSTLVLRSGAPQGCVPSLLLFTLYTNDFTPDHTENSISNSI